MSLGRKTLGGLVWVSVANSINQVLSFVVFVVLARQLNLSEFGAVMLAILVINVFTMFFKDGIVDFLVREDDSSIDDVVRKSTAFWSTIAYGAVLGAILCLVVGPVLGLFVDPVVTHYIFWMSPIVLIGCWTIVHLALVRRNYAFKVSAMRNVVGGLITGVTAVLMAAMGWGAWALVFSRVLGSLAAALVLVLQEPLRPRFVFSASYAATLTRYSYPLIGARLVSYLSSKTPEVALTLFGGTAILALYRVGIRVIEVLNSLLIDPLSNVLLTTLTKVDRAEFGFYVSRTMSVLVLVLSPFFLGVAAVSYPLTLLLFGEKWSESSFVMNILCFQIVPIVIRTVLLISFKASNTTARIWRLSIVELLINALLMGCASMWGGAASVALASVFMSLLVTSVYIRVAATEGNINFSIVGKEILGPCVAAIVMYALVSGAIYSVAEREAWQQILLGILVGAISYPAMLLVFSRKLLRDVCNDALHGVSPRAQKIMRTILR